MNTTVIKPLLTPWLMRALIDWSVIITGFFVFYNFESWLLKILAIIFIGSRQHALSILGHDGGHRLISQNRFVNDLFACVFCFWPLGIPLEGYRKFHFKHHRTVGTPEDPELFHKNLIPQWILPFKPLRLLCQLLIDFVGGGLPHVLILIYMTRPITIMDIAGPIITISTAFYVCWHFDAMWIMGLWYFCLLTSFWAVFRLRIWTEHVGTQGTHDIQAKLWEKLIFLPHNTWCHYQHHENPAVPCWALTEIQEKNDQRKDVYTLLADLSKINKNNV